MATETPKTPEGIRNFRNLLRGLVAVPKAELDARLKARKKRRRKKK